MKSLLIIGAGGHGQVVAEVAEACGYTQIAFLDDNSAQAIGAVGDMKKFLGEYQDALVGIGNNKLRGELIAKLLELGYNVPVLIHPTAYVSPSASLARGTVVEPKAIVNAHTVVNEGAIISVGAIVDHDVEIGRCCHINAGAIVNAGAQIDDYVKIESGEVVLGYQATNVNK